MQNAHAGMVGRIDLRSKKMKSSKTPGKNPQTHNNHNHWFSLERHTNHVAHESTARAHLQQESNTPELPQPLRLYSSMDDRGVDSDINDSRKYGKGRPSFHIEGSIKDTI